MSLPNRTRGASVVEYALLLFLFIGGAAAAVKGTGFAVRDAFQSIGGEVSAEADGTGMGLPPDRRDGGS